MRHRSPAPRLLAAALILLSAGCTAPPPIRGEQAAPSGHGSRLEAMPGRVARQFMVATPHALATGAGAAVLRDGGSALDAAIAVQMVLALVEPQASGIGGGALLMHWDGREVQAWDGRETAPAAADDRMLLRDDGTPMPFAEVSVGGIAAGVPGVVRMLEAVHGRHGRLPWARLFEPAIALAEQGFEVSPRLHRLLQSDQALRRDPLARGYFYAADGQPHPAGHRLRNPALAAVLRAVAAQGSAALHEGPIAADMVARVRGHATRPGRLTEADLAGYRPRQREPLCTIWKRVYRVCGFPPPSSGHLALMQMLGILEQTPPPAAPLADGIPSADWLHVYTEAARLAFADRAAYVGDPDFVDPPAGRWTSLLDAAYLKERAASIGPRSMKAASPGRPLRQPIAFAPQAEQPEYGTSHLSIVDGQGRAVAMTTTIEATFGSRLMLDGGTGRAGGYLLNNELTDFSAVPAGVDGKPVANRVQPGKRPRSSMSPTLVFDARDGRLLMSLGSPLGAAIPHFVAKTMIATLEWGLDAQAAIDLPNVASFNGPTLLEAGRYPARTLDALRARGHEVAEADLNSGVQVILRTSAGWLGAADARREGTVAGE